jgi:hypothetical protein
VLQQRGVVLEQDKEQEGPVGPGGDGGLGRADELRAEVQPDRVLHGQRHGGQAGRQVQARCKHRGHQVFFGL